MEKIYDLSSFSFTATSGKHSIQFAVKSILFAICMVVGTSIMAQPLTGTKNIPGDYATLALAITDLNTQGVGAGGVTLNLLAGNPETAPAGGYVIGGTGSLVLTSASMANPIVIQGNSNNITSFGGQTAGLLNDAVFKLIGADWTTITGFTILENAANTITTAGSNDMTEWGIALLYVTTTDGCQNITIQGNTIDLNRTYQNTFGIYSNSTHTATAPSTSATATGTAGGNHNLKIYGNTVQDVNIGIVIVGPTAAADQNDILEIGTTLGNANTISNYGTTGTFSSYINVSGSINGILVRNTKNYNVSYNSITSSNGAATAGTMRAIYVPAFSGAPTGTFTNNINNNSISLTHGASAILQGIVVESTTGNATSSLNINVNDFTAFTSAVASTSTFTVISNAMAFLNTTISNNTFSNITTNTTGSFTFISNSVTRPANANCEVNDNSIGTAFNKTGAGGTVTFYNSNSSTPASGTEVNSGNNFSNVTVTGATIIAGWISTDGPTTSPFGPNRIVTNNIFTNITGGTSTVTGLNVAYGNNGSTTNDVSGNEISNITSGGTITGLTTAGGKQNFFSNLITGLTSSGASSVVTGFSSTSGTAAAQEFFKNRIYDLSSSSAGGTVNGILISGSGSGQTLNIYNNLIGDLRADIATNAAAAIRGIQITSTGTNSTFNVSFNSIFLNATSSGTDFSTTGVFHTTSITATTAVLNLRNNIIVNTSTPNGTGITSAYRRSSTTLTNYGSVSNYNLFYAGTPGASTVIFHDGTNSDQTLSDYKMRVAPLDASSVSESPNFLSTTGSNANFLHINTTIATQIESGGFNITGITDDFDAEVRQGNGGYSGTGTAPDIGADEFDGIGADLNGPAISYTLIPNTSCLTDRNLTATITDASGVNSAPGTKPRLYYKKFGDTDTYAGNTSSDNGWKYVEATNASSPFSFTTDYTLLQTPVVIGDVIQYFVVAQDLAGTPNVSINSGTFNTPATSVALIPGNFPLTGTINSYTLVAAGLSGTVTIGAAGTYASLTGTGGLFEAINTSGLSASLTVDIIDGTVAETGATALNAINYNGCAAGPYNLTIKPSAGVNTTLSGSVSTALIKLNGADNVTIDGSNNSSSSRNMTLLNTATSTNTAVIWNASLGTGAGAENNTIRNTIIKAGSNTVLSTFGIYVGGTTISTSGTGNDNDNLAIHNNVIGKAYYGIYARGSASGYNNGLNILNNTIGDDVAADYIGFRGMQIFHADGAILEGNTVYNLISTTTNLRGIELGTGFINSFVSKNTIYEINYTGTSFSAGKGISISTGSTSSNVTISNNVIYGLKGHGSSTATNNSWGIMLEGGGGYNIYYNSVNLSDDRTATGSSDLHGAMYVASSVTDIDLRNNVLVATAAAGNANGKTYGLYSLAANTAYLTINYNDYWATGTNRFAGFISSTDRTTLADMQAGFGQNVNSLVSDPLFNSNTNLQLQTGSPLENAGTHISGFTTDILGMTRDMATPTIGAYENVVDVAAPSIIYTPLTFTCTTGDRALNGVTIIDGSGVPTSGLLQPRIYYKKNMGSWFSSQGTLASGSGLNGMWNFTIIAADMGGLVVGDVISYFVIAQDIASPINITSNPAAGLVASDVNTVTTPPTTPNTYSISPTLNGTFMVGAAQTYTTLTAAINAYNTACLGGPVVFELIDASYGTSETFPITIQSNEYASSVNTLTIKATGAATITGSSSSAIIILNGADYVIIDGSQSNTANTICPLSTATRDLTIVNTSTSTTSAVVWIQSNGTNGATNNKIINCNITGNSSTSTLFGLGSGSATISTSSVGTDNDNNSFVNNNITKVQNGIYSKGASAANKNTGTVINQNIMIGTSPDNIGRTGIWTGFEDFITISGNRIENISHTSDLFAISLGISNVISNTTTTGSEVTNATLTQNVIHNITNTGTNSAAGILLASAASGTTLIANNMISAVSANGTSTDFCTGIFLGGGTGSTTQVYYNSVHMNGTIQGSTAGSTQSFCLAVTNTTAPILDFRNNILVNTQLPNTSGTTKFYAIGLAYSSTAGNYADLTSDNNDLYVMPGSNYFVGITGGLSAGTTRTALSDWQAETGRDAASQSVNPVFSSSSDLHINIGDAGNTLLDGTAGVLSITNDIDCETRNATSPDIGADEFTIVSCAGAIGGTASGSTTYCGSGTPTITGSGYSVGIGSTYQWQSSVDQAFTTPIDIPGQTNPASLNTGVVSSTTYFRLKVTCNTGNAIDYSTIVTITVNPQPTSSASSNSPLCEGSSLNLTGSTDIGVTFSWTGPNGFSSTSQNPSINNAPIAASGIYTFQATSAEGCSATSNVTVVVNPTPATPVVSPVSICSGGTGTLTVTNPDNNPDVVGTKIGTGTSTTSVPGPYRRFYGGHRFQMLYTAAEVSASGISAGQLTSLSFFVNSVPGGITSMSNVEIKLKNTSSTSLTTTFETGTTSVYTATSYQPVVGANTHIFNGTAFSWDGTSNLLVEFCFNNNDGGETSTTTEYTIVTGSVITYPAQNNPDVCSNATGVVDTERPNILLTVGGGPATYTWNPGGLMGTSVMVSPAATTTYTVTAEFTNGCTSSSTAEVVVNTLVVSNTNNSGGNSLRDVINCAPPGSTITFEPALSGQTITLTSGEIAINKNLTLAGLGAMNLNISGNNASRIFHVLSGNTFNVEDLTLSNATSVTNGGAFWNEGTMTLDAVIISGSTQNGLPKGFTGTGSAITEFIGNSLINN